MENSLNHLIKTIRVLSVVILFFVVIGAKCDDRDRHEDVSSQAVLTKGIYAQIEANALGDSRTHIEASF